MINIVDYRIRRSPGCQGLANHTFPDSRHQWELLADWVLWRKDRGCGASVASHLAPSEAQFPNQLK